MDNPNIISVNITAHLVDCPPQDESIDPSLLPLVAAEVARRFDSTAIYDQIDQLACGILREMQPQQQKGIDRLNSSSASRHDHHAR